MVKARKGIGNAPGGKGAARGSRGAGGRNRESGKGSWFFEKRPVMGFVLVFAFLMGLYYAITWVPVVNMKLLPAYMRLNAQASAVICNVFGEGAVARGTSLSSSRYSVDIKHGCDAIDPSALFVAAVLAFPAAWRSKLPGVIAGTFVLAVVNLIRIVSLFYTGIYFPRAFEIMHVDVWQPVFILLSLFLWVMWAWWATRSTTGRPDGTIQTS